MQKQYLFSYKFIYQLFLLVLLLASGNIAITAQTQENLVPNPSFERFSRVPIGWFYKGQHFTDVMKYWNAPTGASPDIFGPKVIIPKHWKEKGFGQQIAHSGASLVGITTYGCEEGKPHCREYLQIQLKEALVVGQKYHFEFWASSLPKSLRTNRLGAYFSTEEIQIMDDITIEVQPQVEANNVITASNGRWAKISATFIAKEEASYLIIGNFYTDAATKVLKARSDGFNYAYYYIDDVVLKKKVPILEVPIKADDLSKTPIEVGRVVTLKNIFFETDKYELLPRSFVELNKLLTLLRNNPNTIIEIRGHTDSRGNADYNQYLSRKRAKSVMLFLTREGIESFRLQYVGFGSELPAASNDTTQGRQENRRVEFKILSNKYGMN